MSVVINSNYAATVASNNLASSSANLQKSLNRLSSGSKIVSPADDAGGLAVSMRLSAAARRSGAAAINVANSGSLLQTQDGVLKVAGKVIERIGELKVLATDPTKSATDIANYDTEFSQLKLQLTSLAAEKFNGINLFNNALTAQVSEDGSQTVALSAKNLAGNAGVTAINGAANLAAVTITNISAATDGIATFRATNGAEQSRLGFAAEVLTTNKANLEAANSRIVDVDVAEESTQLARWNTLVQAGTAMLSQANQSAQTALKLLQ
ncbi:flagellin [Rariglobus hedericola]|uniref:Flagellin n=1 Tax=Rariglobus hedericola TaxID=2597822 RepID=A0A556QPK6_9BACT|nr:flagellin [Rariglobus hedericola]TSJ78580.1 flagellin [Rariglobus hedericola]